MTLFVVGLLSGACGEPTSPTVLSPAAASYFSPAEAPALASAPQESTGTTVYGTVTDGTTGKPMPGVIVEFKNLHGGNAHVTTDSNGQYAVELPADVYTALALVDDPNSTINCEVVGGDNSISVPPSTRVDFVCY
jgi:hypothetical protein